MNIREYVSLTASLLVITSLGIMAKNRPNIVFIMSDDHTQQAISAYGGNLNKTPNIDRIANEGAIFSRAYVTNSISSPSRAVMLTGKFSHINARIDNSTSPFDWSQATFPKILKENGYSTALIGKIHIDGQPEGFDYSNVLPGQGEYYNPDFIENGITKRHTGYVTTITTQLALEWLETKRDKEKPFCLLVHHKAPHRNWKAEEKYLNMYEDTVFTPPASFFDNYSGRGAAAKHQKMEIARDMDWGHDMKFELNPFTGEPTTFNRELLRFDSSQLKNWRLIYNTLNQEFVKNLPSDNELALWKYNRYIRDYLKCVKSVDDGVGQILDYLKKTGLEENTIIVYTSDQGFYLGEHGWFDKRFMYEESFRTPLLIKFPNEIKKGSVCNKLVQNIDFAPYFLDVAGIKIPKDINGQSFRSILSNSKSKWRDALYYHYYEYPGPHLVYPHYGIRTERYKLIHFYKEIDEWELYDLQTDPHEMMNLYNDSQYINIRNRMHKKLKHLQQKYKDNFSRN
jgi:arylsulfatase A-like enzyme